DDTEHVLNALLLEVSRYQCCAVDFRHELSPVRMGIPETFAPPLTLRSWLRSRPPRPESSPGNNAILQLDFHERELERVGVSHVVLDTSRPDVRKTRDQLVGRVAGAP